jgi:hypothetical protein
MPASEAGKKKMREQAEGEVENLVGKLRAQEHKECTELIPRGGQFNRVFEKLGIPYEAQPQPPPSQKRKATPAKKEVAKEVALKRARKPSNSQAALPHQKGAS